MDLLEKVEKALALLEENKESETAVPLTFSELRGIRSDLLVANYRNDLAAENLQAGLEFRGKKRSESI